MNARALSLVLWCALLRIGAAPYASGQEGSSAADEQARQQILDQLKVANEGSPAVRPQAARRLLSFGEAAAAVVLEKSAGSVSGLATLGKDVAEVVAELPGEELRALCWSALSNVDFPWRPSIARSLAKSARPEEGPTFLTLLEDPISYVRGAAVAAMEKLKLHDASERLNARLADPDDVVRRAAACLLDDWGQPNSLHWLIEELKRDDRFFDRALGKTARYAAARALEQRLGKLEGYDPAADPRSAEQRGAIEAIATRAAERAGEPPPDLPFAARASQEALVDRIGLEIRSCRRGEFFVRWCDGDRLAIGLGNPHCYSLPAGTVEALLARSRAAVETLGGVHFFGAPGCDGELLHLRSAAAERASVLSISKGPDPLADLRPPVLGAFFAELVATFPVEAIERDLPGFRAAVLAAFEAVGGAIPNAAN